MSDAPAFETVGDATDVDVSDSRDLWVMLKIYMGGDCPLTSVGGDIQNVDLQQMNGECRAKVVTREDEDLSVLQTQQAMGSNCISQVFHQHGCVPHVVDTDEESITVTVYPDTRETIPKLVESIRDLGYVLDIERLLGVTQDVIQDSTVLCDLSILTEKQREAVEIAVERGYYARDGDVDMDTMADDLDISKSALSRRLKSAEAKLMLELISRPADESC